MKSLSVTTQIQVFEQYSFCSDYKMKFGIVFQFSAHAFLGAKGGN